MAPEISRDTVSPSGYHVSLTVWVTDSFPLSGIRVPREVHCLVSAATDDAELRRFARWHNLNLPLIQR